MRSVLLAGALATLGLFVGSGCASDPPACEGDGCNGVPQIDFSIEGLSAPVEVSYDASGVLHLACKTDEDCMTALGYFHAEHRFFQMDLFRRAARGRLGTLVRIGIDQDEYVRGMLSTAQGEPIEEAIWRETREETKAHYIAYSKGINAWLGDLREGRNGARLSEECDVAVVACEPSTIPDWDPLDSVAFARAQTMLLSDTSAGDILAGELVDSLAPAIAADLLDARPIEAAFTIAPDASPIHALRAPLDPVAIAARDARLASYRPLMTKARELQEEVRSFLGPVAGFGSNNWVVAPERTKAGKALLANDPHLPLDNPSVWFLVELDSKTKGQGTLHAAGVTFPGVPSIAIGRNEHIAWGATVTYFDVADVYLEKLNADGTTVLFQGQEVPIVTRDHTFELAGSDPKVRTLRWVPHHGPIVEYDLAKREAISVRWAGQEPTLEIVAFHDLMVASSIPEAKEAMKTFGVGAMNWVFIDTAGGIGWYPHARIPNRPWANMGDLAPWLPLPGDTGTAEWDGYVSEAQIPQLFDPPSGIIATSNQDLVGATLDGDPTNGPFPYMQSWQAEGSRQRRILDLLEEGGDEHTPESMTKMQSDTVVLPAMRMVPPLLQALEGLELSEDGKKVENALRSWTQFSCPTGLDGLRPDSPKDPDPVASRESIGCMAFHSVLVHLLKAAYHDEVELVDRALLRNGKVGDVLVRVLQRALVEPELLASGESLWDDVRTSDVVETREEILVRAFNASGRKLAVTPNLGPDVDDWRWGRVHTLTLRSRLGAVAPHLDYGPFAGDGGLHTIDVATPYLDGSSMTYDGGASMRIVNESSPEGITSWLQFPGGRDIQRDGEHYNDLMEPYLRNEPFRLAFTRDEVKAAATDTLVVGP